ncbi:MAG: helix-turn-helix domain-containing protein [Hyphomicrobium sp.]|nr:helix-turn-helix domain-containing protein [Hyphomicrobium sp.]
MPHITKHNRQTMARHLRLGRQTRGHSVERIAAAFGVPVSVIEKVETGHLLPTSVELHRMCKWYGLDAYAVFWPLRLRVIASTVFGARKQDDTLHT